MIYPERLKISKEILSRLANITAADLNRINKRDPKKIALDWINPKKPIEKIELLKRYLKKELRDLKLLEIGAGIGSFIIVSKQFYGIDSYGIEPSGTGFNNSLEIAHHFLFDNGIEPHRIINSVGEYLPFKNNSFDIVYSTNVLEHVNNPRQVINEAVRVCKPGGLIQIVVPSYGSFWEGHYGCLYFPYIPKYLYKGYLKIILNRDPWFLESINTNINYYSVNKWLQPYIKHDQVQVLSYGKEIFKYRMATLDFSEWGSLSKLRAVVKLMHKFKVQKLAARIILKFNLFTPLILTLRKLK